MNKIRALAAFSPDALSSLTYASQEIYLGLAAAGAAGLALGFPIAAAITLLLAIVALSYSQTIEGYPNGGGSYVVARENLGPVVALVAGAALLLDYVLTAAVSLTAGVEAIASAFPVLWPYRVALALVLLLLITLLNLRGLSETGTVMSIPVYLFLVSFLGMMGYAVVTQLRGGPADLAATAPLAVKPLTTFLILHAFSAGCTALTGIEAISNSTPAFRPPEARNARITLAWMSVLMGVLFAGAMGLVQYLGITAGPDETILSALTAKVLGRGPLYVVVQFSTLAILAVAANTSFTGFPRVATILSQDRFLPRQLNNLGDRLVFSNGILLLSLLTAVLIIGFGGNSHLLVPLFAVGAFSAFTLSQAGMVRHWIKVRAPGWHWKALVNGVGALTTGLTAIVIAVSKFLEGAWISVLVIPLLILIFLQIYRHYEMVRSQLTMKGLPPSLRPYPKPRIVIPVSGVHRGMIDAVRFACSISDNVTAVFVNMDPNVPEDSIRRSWNEWLPDMPLVILDSPYRSLVEPLLKYLDQTDTEYNDGQQAVLVLPELIPAKPWQAALHNQMAHSLKDALLFNRRERGFQRVIIDVPYHLKDETRSEPGG